MVGKIGDRWMIRLYRLDLYDYSPKDKGIWNTGYDMIYDKDKDKIT